MRHDTFGETNEADDASICQVSPSINHASLEVEHGVIRRGSLHVFNSVFLFSFKSDVWVLR